MVTPTYPGVYIQEIPSGVRTITSVSTSVAAFIDFFKEGPMNEAVQIFGMADFERAFGGLDDRSEASYAIAQFFLNGGSEAQVIRVAAEDVSNPLEIASVKVKSTGGTDVLQIFAANEGVWGNNLRVDIDYDTEDPTKYFNLSVTRYDSSSADARAIKAETFLKLSPDSTDSRYVTTIVNDESKIIVINHLSTGSPTVLPAPTGTLGGDISALLVADFNGFSGKKLKVKIGSSTVTTATLDIWAAGEVATLKQMRAKVEKAIRNAASTDAAFAGAKVDLVGDKFLVVHSGKGGTDYDAKETVVITNFGGGDITATDLKLTAGGGAFANVQEYPVGYTGADVSALKAGTEGADGLEPGATEIIGSRATEPYTGMYALDYVDLFNILCIPRAADLADTEMTAVISNALTYCEQERAFMIIDIPSTINAVDEIKDWLDDNADFRHNNSAVYFPRLLTPDSQNDYRLRNVGACGTMAGIFARTDSTRGVWKAPAGIEASLKGVSELDIKLTDAQNGTLNPLGINCLRTFPVYGSIAWGGRTTQGADVIGSEWKYIPVRRVALMIEESLFRGTKWVVFEPNDEPLWAKIRMNIGAYMMSLFRQGAFQGTAPKDAFFVKCDKETTTQDDINKGIVNIVVGFAPLKPAEFVVISIQQIAGELSA